jgi:hypothetical protein
MSKAGIKPLKFKPANNMTSLDAGLRKTLDRYRPILERLLNKYPTVLLMVVASPSSDGKNVDTTAARQLGNLAVQYLNLPRTQWWPAGTCPQGCNQISFMGATVSSVKSGGTFSR